MKKTNKVIVIFLCIAIFSIFALGSGSSSSSNSSSSNTESSSTKENSESSSVATNTPKSTKDPSPMPTPDTIITTSDFKNMKMGDIGKVDDVYVGLSYVKKMDKLTTALGSEDAKEGYEVVVAFFDFYNCSEEVKDVDPNDITCYADGTQVEDVETYIKVVVDGIRQFYNADLDAGTQMISCQDFEVPNGWSELKFFYESKCVWTVKNDEVKNDDFQFKSMYCFGFR